MISQSATFFVCVATSSMIFSMDVIEEKVSACMDISLFAGALNENSSDKSNTIPYSSNTLLTLLVCKAIIEIGNTLNYALNDNVQILMGNIAQHFIVDATNQNGWTVNERIPDQACLDALCILKNRDQTEKNWWNVQANNINNHAPIMRAYPFGIAFYTTPHLAGQLAATHATITHGHSAVKAACAAMAHAIARSINHYNTQENSIDNIIDTMAHEAQQHDSTTAQKIRDAKIAAQKNDFQKFLNSCLPLTCATNALSATVYLFAYSQQCTNTQELAYIIHDAITYEMGTNNLCCLIGPLLGAYYGKKIIDEIIQTGIDRTEKAINIKHTHPHHNNVYRTAQQGLLLLFFLYFIVYIQ